MDRSGTEIQLITYNPEIVMQRTADTHGVLSRLFFPVKLEEGTHTYIHEDKKSRQAWRNVDDIYLSVYKWLTLNSISAQWSNSLPGASLFKKLWMAFWDCGLR
jgi:hypothetical protein